VPIKSLTLKDKIAYYAKVRQANYASSLRLEGFVMPSKAEKHVELASNRKKGGRDQA
jgi:hypothetical protein